MPLEVGKVQITDLPGYVQKVVEYNYGFAVPQKYIIPLSEYNMALQKEIKILNNLILLQIITFRAVALKKLYPQIDTQCTKISEIIIFFLAQYNEARQAYICPPVTITNIGTLNNFFVSLSTCHKDFSKLIEKIKDKKAKGKWQKEFKSIKLTQSSGSGKKSIEFLNMILQGIIAPVFEAAAIIVAREKELKERTCRAQLFFEKDAEQLKLLKVETTAQIEQDVIVPCSLLIANFDAEVGVQKGQKIETCRNSIRGIKIRLSTLKLKLENVKKVVDQVLKSIKYGANPNVGRLVILKFYLKEMVNLANEVFEMMKDPNTTEEQREAKIVSTIKKIKEFLSNIEIAAAEVKWGEGRADEIGQNAPGINREFYEVLEKLEKLYDNPNIAKLRSIMAQLNTSKPSAVITFITKYGGRIIMALGILAALL